MSTVIKSLYESLLDLLYEHRCPFEAEHICSVHGHCTADGWHNKVCSFCFNELVDLSLKSRKNLDGIQEVISAAEYKNHAKTIIQKLKWSNPVIARAVAELMHYKLTNIIKNIDFDYLVPVPGLTNEDRDWVPSLLLTEELSKLLDIPFIEPIQKIEETRLFKLDKQKRKEAVKGAYEIKATHNHGLKSYALEGKKLLLIDDIVTSGATLEVCAELLKQINQDNKVSALTFASVSSF